MPLIDVPPVMIGGKKIGGRDTTIVSSVFSRTAGSLVDEFQRGIYDPSLLYEIRYDLFQEKSLENLRMILDYLQKRHIDFIFTYRSGESSLTREVYRFAMDMQVPAVDIDTNSFTEIEMDSFNGSVILSTHDFEGGRVSHMLRAMLKLGGDIFKLASSYKNAHAFLLDMSDLYTLKEELKVPIVLVPMGEKNSVLRLFSGYFLSDIVYASSGRNTAEGQLTRQEYEKFLEKY